MFRHIRATAAVMAALALVLAPSAAGAAGRAPMVGGALQLGEEVVLPPVYGDTLPRVYPILGSTKALAWEANPASIGADVPADMRFTVHGGAQRGNAGPTRYDQVSLSGTQLASALLTGGRNEGAKAVDVATGEETRLVAEYPLPERFLTGTGDGWLDADRYGVRRTTLPSREARGFGKPTIAGVPDYAVNPQQGAVADPRGALLYFMDDVGFGDPNANQVFTYLDYAAGYTTLRGGVGTEISVALSSMDATTVAFVQGSSLKYFDRSDPAAVSTVTLGGGVAGIAVNDGKIAFARSVKDAAGKSVYQVRSGPLAGPWATVATPLKTTNVVRQADNGDFLLLSGSTVRDYGMYRLHPGATTLSGPVALFGPGAPLGIGAAAGRLESLRPEASPDAAVRTVTSDAAISDLSVGKESLLAADIGGSTPPELSGGHSAYVDYSKYPNTEAVVLDGTKQIARYKVAPRATLDLSGQRLLVAVVCPGTEDCTGLETPTTQVIDLDTGRRTAVPYTRGIFGSAITYATDSGQIRRRDLGTGKETTLRPAGIPEGMGEFDRRLVELRMDGDWVLWCIPHEINSLFDGAKPPVETVAVNTVTGARVDLTEAVHVDRPGLEDLHLSDGIAAWIDSDDRQVHAADLSTGVVQAVGVAHREFENRRFLALSSEFLAWVAPDDTTHVIALGTAADGPARYLGALDRAAFSPKLTGAAGDFRPQIDVSRPLGSWAMTITGSTSALRASARGTARAATAAAVRTLAGSAVTGGVRPSWDGLTSGGQRVPDGIYTWTLRGTGPGGALQRPGGAAMTGTVRVDTTTPTPKVTLPVTVAATATSKGIALSWKSTETAATYKVTVARGTKDKNGKLTWSSAKTWIARTATTSGTYKGSKIPYALKRATSYRFTVTATDPAGNHASRTATTTIK